MKCISSGSALFAKIKTIFREEVHHTLDNGTCDPIMYTMGSLIYSILVCMGKSTRIQRVNNILKNKRNAYFNYWIRVLIIIKLCERYLWCMEYLNKSVLNGWLFRVMLVKGGGALSIIKQFLINTNFRDAV